MKHKVYIVYFKPDKTLGLEHQEKNIIIIDFKASVIESEYKSIVDDPEKMAYWGEDILGGIGESITKRIFTSIQWPAFNIKHLAPTSVVNYIENNVYFTQPVVYPEEKVTLENLQAYFVDGPIIKIEELELEIDHGKLETLWNEFMNPEKAEEKIHSTSKLVINALINHLGEDL